MKASFPLRGVQRNHLLVVLYGEILFSARHHMDSAAEIFSA